MASCCGVCRPRTASSPTTAFPPRVYVTGSPWAVSNVWASHAADSAMLTASPQDDADLGRLRPRAGDVPRLMGGVDVVPGVVAEQLNVAARLDRDDVRRRYYPGVPVRRPDLDRHAVGPQVLDPEGLHLQPVPVHGRPVRPGEGPEVDGRRPGRQGQDEVGAFGGRRGGRGVEGGLLF